MDFMQQYNKELEKELTQFLFMCGKEDGNYLIEPVKESNLNEKVRLACIATILGYKKLLLKIFAQNEKYIDQLTASLENVSRDFSKIDGWVNSFIDNIEHLQAQKLIRGFWEERKTNINPDDFHLSRLLN